METISEFLPPDAPSPASQQPVVRATSATQPQSQPERVLIAEDNTLNQKVVQGRLARLGYRSDVVSNGLEVLAALRRQSYDIEFMDVQMPELDGMEASRRIARGDVDVDVDAGERVVRPWIIALTANAFEGDREACLAAGMDDFLSKPVRLADVAAALARARTARSTCEAPDPVRR